MGRDLPYPKKIRLPSDAYSNREHVFHVVVRAMPNTVPFRGAVGAFVWNAILAERERDAITLLAACLMPDHLHAILKPQNRDVVAWLNGFKSFTTHEARGAGGPNILWQPSFFDRRLRDEAEFEKALAYVRKNPVEAGLVEEEDDWAWLWWADAPGAS